MGTSDRSDAQRWNQLTAGMTPEEFESLCTRCAKCCHMKIIVGHTVLITPFPCRFLDLEKHCCTVYDKRKEKNPHCLGVQEGLKVSAFPASCPYVERFAPEGYLPAVDTWSWEGQWLDFDDLADDLDVPPDIREAVRARGPGARLPWEETPCGQRPDGCPHCDQRA